MTKDDLISNFIANASIVANGPVPDDEIGDLWYNLCVRAVAMHDSRPSIADELPSSCWCCDIWEFLWPEQREAFQEQNHILWQAVQELGGE